MSTSSCSFLEESSVSSGSEIGDLIVVPAPYRFELVLHQMAPTILPLPVRSLTPRMKVG